MIATRKPWLAQMPWIVERWDDNPENTATFQTWVRVANFATEEQAKAYVQRAIGPTQVLAYRRES